MKKELVVMLVIWGGVIAGQWEFIREPMSGGFGGKVPYWRCPDVFFLPGTKKAWICGMAHPAHTYYGVSRTTDGGYTWEPQSTSPYWPSYLLRVFFINESHGWVVGGYSITGGYNPILLRTTDGGNTWQGQSLGLGRNLWAVHFIDTLIGFAGGVEGLFLRTTDGGINWEYVPAPGSYYFTNLYFKDRSTGLASGFDANQPDSIRGRIWETTDAGNTWTELSIPTCTDIYAMFFLDSLRGWFVPRKYYPAYCYRTTDGGSTWTQSNGPIEPGAPPNSIIFVDSLNGWIAGGYSEMEGGKGAIWRTTDGGVNWIKQYTPSCHGLWTASAANDSEALAVGFHTVLHTTDRGNTWVYREAGDRIWGIYALDTLNLFGSGWGTIFIKSTDGGLSWEISNIDSAKNWQLYSVAFPTKDIGWIGGAGFLKHTTNGGQTWVDQNPIGPGQGIYGTMSFLDTLNGWLGGHQSNYTIPLFQTTDGGNSWIRHDFPINEVYGLTQVKFVDTLWGWVGGISQYPYDPLIYRTTDGGTTWERQTITPYGSVINACDFVSRTHGWAGGDGLYTTTDGGETWILRSGIGDIYSLGLADSLNGWVVTSGKIYHSRDFGLTFTKEFEWEWGGTNAQGMTVIDSAHAYVCWDYGFVLSYNPQTGVAEQGQVTLTDLNIFPNPCQRSATISYQLARKDKISLKLYDVTGRLNRTLFHGNQEAGWHKMGLDFGDLPSGIYFLRIEGEQKSFSCKIVVTK